MISSSGLFLLVAATPPCSPCVFNAPAWKGGSLADTGAVLRHVVAALPDEVTVYPSENHFYFTFPSAEGEVRGNLWFDVLLRDQGKLALAYAVREGGEKVAEYEADLGSAEMRLRRIAASVYSLTVDRRTVTVRLYELAVGLPAGVRLRAGEQYVGPSLDDSGVLFALLVCAPRRHFLWLLDERMQGQETLRRLQNGLLVGERTRFAYWDDAPNGRKVLVGVAREEIRLNSAYDGPFDQLPDNAIAAGQVDLLGALRKAGYKTSGLDRFGRTRDGGIRMSLTPYARYRNAEDLDTIAACGKVHAASSDGLYACLAGAR